MKFFPSFTRSSSILGIHIGCEAVKLVELNHHKNAYNLASYAYVKFLSETRNNSEAIVNSLKQAIRLSGTTSISAAIAISDLQVLNKTIAVDATLNQQEISLHIRQLAQQHFNLQPQELLLDFEFIRKKNTELTEVNWVAARRRDIETKIHLLKQAGLATKIVDIDAHVIARALFSKNKNEHGHIGIIYIGESALMLMIFHQNNLIYSKAESYKTAPLSAEQNNLAKEIFLPVITRLLRLSPINTLQPAIEYFLLGGEFISAEFAATLQLHTGITTQLVNPFTSIEPSTLSKAVTDIPTHEFIISLGLAMRDLP